MDNGAGSKKILGILEFSCDKMKVIERLNLGKKFVM